MDNEPLIFDCKIIRILRNGASKMSQVHNKAGVSLLRPGVSDITNCT